MKDFILKEGQGSKSYQEEVDKVKEYALNVLKDGESVRLSRKNGFKCHRSEMSGFSPIINANWFLAVGDASGYVVAEITRNNTKYTVNIRYMVYDYYDRESDDDRELISGFSNATMWKMTNLGVAKPYFVYGEIVQEEIFRGGEK